MNHKEFYEMVSLSLLNELNEDENKKLNEHLLKCCDCRIKMIKEKKILLLMKNHKSLSSDNELIKEARNELHGALRSVRKNNYNPHSALSNYFNNILRFRIILQGAAMLVIGLIAGYFIFKSDQPVVNIHAEYNVLNEETAIRNIRFLDSDARDGQIEFVYDAVKQVKLKGSVTDQNIQSVLAYSMLKEQNPGVRLNSINLINAYQPNKFDDEVKQALIGVAKYDKTPGVKREALKLLRDFKYDKEIQDSFIYVLLNDTSAGMRIEAINSLLEVSKNGISLSARERSLLENKIKYDENKYVQYQIKSILKEY